MPRPFTLADGLPSHDRRLDRARQWDPSNNNYPVAELLAGAPPAAFVGHADERGRTYKAGPVLDQKQEGACVGFGFTGELAADPVPAPEATYDQLEQTARALYAEARAIWPGPNQPGEGTSVLAGAKAAQARGWFDEYRWGASRGTVDELIRVLEAAAKVADAQFGTAVVGVDWYDGMYETDPDSGLVTVQGPLVGGHCLFIRGVLLHPRIAGHKISEPLFRWRNSWGHQYGHAGDGDGLIRASDLEHVLGPQPEVCYPVRRHDPFKAGKAKVGK